LFKKNVIEKVYFQILQTPCLIYCSGW